MDTLLPCLTAQQRKWQPLVDRLDHIDLAGIRLIGGLDIQWNNSGTEGVGVLAVLSFPGGELIHTEVEKTTTDVPWQSGFLGFRECPCYCRLLQQVRHTEHDPSLCLVDGFGTLHPRGCGSASQLGIQSNMVTIGVAKSLTQPTCSLSEKKVKDALDREKKLTHNLINDAGQTIGCAVRRSLTARQPVYVSVGHKVSLETACSIVHACCQYRIPEPIRQADIIARRLMRGVDM